jgi:hypothetical protein
MIYVLHDYQNMGDRPDVRCTASYCNADVLRHLGICKPASRSTISKKTGLALLLVEILVVVVVVKCPSSWIANAALALRLAQS